MINAAQVVTGRAGGATSRRPAPIALRATRGGLRALGAVLPATAARVAERLWCTPPRPRPGALDEPTLDRAERLTVEAAGRRVAAWTWGDGPLAVLVHGWGGHAGQLAPLGAALADAGFRALAFDAPGHGRSGPSAMGGRRSNLIEFRRALEAVVAHAAGRFGPLHAVVAHSLGCTAAAWAIRAGALAPARAVFVAPAASPTRYAERFGRLLGLSDDVQRRWRRSLEERLDFRWEELEMALPPDAARAPRLLVVHDRDDADTAWEEGRAVADAWPGAALHSTAGLGHRRVLRDAGVAARTADFVADRA